MNAAELQQLVDGAVAVARVVAPYESVIEGIVSVVVSAFTNHATASLPEIQAEWVRNEVQSAALMKPGGSQP